MQNLRRGSSMHGKRGSCCNCTNFMSAPLEIDLFAKKPEMRLPNGSTRYTSFIGCMCSLVYMAAVVLFGIFTMRNIVDRNDVSVDTKVDRDYWDAEEIFPAGAPGDDNWDATKDI